MSKQGEAFVQMVKSLSDVEVGRLSSIRETFDTLHAAGDIPENFDEAIAYFNERFPGITEPEINALMEYLTSAHGLEFLIEEPDIFETEPTLRTVSTADSGSVRPSVPTRRNGEVTEERHWADIYEELCSDFNVFQSGDESAVRRLEVRRWFFSRLQHIPLYRKAEQCCRDLDTRRFETDPAGFERDYL